MVGSPSLNLVIVVKASEEGLSEQDGVGGAFGAAGVRWQGVQRSNGASKWDLRVVPAGPLNLVLLELANGWAFAIVSDHLSSHFHCVFCSLSL